MSTWQLILVRADSLYDTESALSGVDQAYTPISTPPIYQSMVRALRSAGVRALSPAGVIGRLHGILRLPAGPDCPRDRSPFVHFGEVPARPPALLQSVWELLVAPLRGDEE